MGKRRFYTCAENAKNNDIYNLGGVSFVNVVYRQDDVLDEFSTEKVVSSDDGKTAVGIVDPIRILFAQKRLDNLGNRAVEQIVNYFKDQPTDPFEKLRAKCSDSDLIKVIKSRHIQQPCEILAWARACEEDMQQFTATLAELQKQQVANQTSNIEENGNEILNKQ